MIYLSIIHGPYGFDKALPWGWFMYGQYVCPMRGRLIAAFAAVYLIWGSTYLAIRFAVETMPPLLMAAARFGISGLILFGIERYRRIPGPTRVDWRTGLISSSLLLLGGNGTIGWAEQRVTSGMAALLVAIVPLWMVLLEWLRPGGRRPPLLVFIGVGLGLAGLVQLVGVDDGSRESVDLLGAGVLTLASLSWAVGSLYVKHAPRPSSGLYGAATQMIMGGVWLLAASLLVGEFTHFNPAQISTKSALGFAYLTTFGSLVGFTAYFYLLAHTTAAKASTYAYINPVVAVFLGWLLAHEPVTMHTIISAVVILAGVAIITIARDTEAMEPAEEQAVA